MAVSGGGDLVAVIRLFLVEDRPERGEVLFWRALIGFPLRCRLLGDFVIKDREFQPRCQSREIGAAAALVMIGEVEGERWTVRLC